MNNNEKQQLKNWALKFFESSNIGFDLFDFEHEIDLKLTLAENKTILKDKLKLFFNKFSDEQIKNIKKTEAEFIPQTQIDAYNSEQNEVIEKEIKQNFEKSINEIFKNNNLEILEQKFFYLNNYINLIIQSDLNGLIVEGEAGTGKSYSILKQLKESKKEFIYCAGFSTPLELYNFLYENNSKIIFFDDTKNLFSNSISLEILKACLFSPIKQRVVRYLSTTDKLKAPPQFEFFGKIIIAVNKIADIYTADIKAVIDRTIFYKIKFSYSEKIQVLAELAKQNYKNLLLEQRNYIFNWIKDNTTAATTNLNFRLLYKFYELFIYSPKNFERLAKELLHNSRNKEIILSILKRYENIKDAEEEFIKTTGLSRRTFYNLKKELVQKCN